MRVAVRVDAPSLAEIEAFLSAETGERVALGRVWLVSGRTGRLVTRLARARAVTFGPAIFFAHAPHPASDERALDRFGALLVHECVHVLQYQRLGAARFVLLYLKSYFTSLMELRSCGATARRSAYLRIPFERAAFTIEAAWTSRQRR